MNTKAKSWKWFKRLLAGSATVVLVGCAGNDPAQSPDETSMQDAGSSDVVFDVVSDSSSQDSSGDDASSDSAIADTQETDSQVDGTNDVTTPSVGTPAALGISSGGGTLVSTNYTLEVVVGGNGPVGRMQSDRYIITAGLGARLYCP